MSLTKNTPASYTKIPHLPSPVIFPHQRNFIGKSIATLGEANHQRCACFRIAEDQQLRRPHRQAGRFRLRRCGRLTRKVSRFFGQDFPELATVCLHRMVAFFGKHSQFLFWSLRISSDHLRQFNRSSCGNQHKINRRRHADDRDAGTATAMASLEGRLKSSRPDRSMRTSRRCFAVAARLTTTPSGPPAPPQTTRKKPDD